MTVPGPEEIEALFAAALARDRDATNQFFQFQHRNLWLPFVRRRWPTRLWARESAEDVLQAAEITICTTFRQFEGDLEHWKRLALTILNHEVIERIRYWDAECRQADRTFSAERGDWDQPGFAEEFYAREPTPSSDVARMNLRLEIEQYLSELTDHERLAFVMRDEGRSWSEIGTALGLSADAARKLNERREDRARLDSGRFQRHR